ncbi:APC family permease [Xinfangfangia sp. CPCC 101601]|uniref:APC family permease n=1 Tax=Pseudogemmobacter lacusdianii TaxID=3069608 RepID=A0ABU0W1D6_9RHOB|nr:APC family permease [Xinfangfangia sp. CPCC 101601]MDQ2067835.1 APC family permease [Xinfangfangia sp. CPCC 101601]
MSEIKATPTNQLRRNSLGLIAVTFMVISAAAPLTGVAGAMPLAFLLGNGTGVPLTFILITLLMLAFAAGYVAMSRHVKNAGAFYAYAARGLDGRVGGAVAIVAMVSYNAMQFGLIGLLGGISAGVFGEMGLNLPWWMWSLIAILLVGILGYRQVDLSAKVLVAVVALEYLIVLVVDFAILFSGGHEGTGLAVNIFDFNALTTGSLTTAILMCFGSFIGIEATTIYGEEARDPEKTIPRATYLAVLMIGVFFVFTTWLMIAGTGAAELMPMLGGLEDPTAHFFILAETYTSPTVAMIAGLLLVTSLFAALSAFHNYIARYSFVAGREGLLPPVFGQTHITHESPHIGSVVQTIGAVIVLAIFAGLGLDPIVHMFTWISQLGTLGVIAMMCVTSIAVIAFFRKPGITGSPLQTLILPLVAAVVLAGLFAYIFANYGDLTGTTGGNLGWILPSLIPLAAIIGFLLASRLKANDPARFAKMGENQR